MIRINLTPGGDGDGMLVPVGTNCDETPHGAQQIAETVGLQLDDRRDTILSYQRWKSAT